MWPYGSTLAGAAMIHTLTMLISWQLGSGVAVAKAFAGRTQGRCEVIPSVQAAKKAKHTASAEAVDVVGFEIRLGSSHPSLQFVS